MYQTDRSFKRANERVIGEDIPEEIWELTLDFLRLSGIHEPFTNNDVGISGDI